MVNYYIAEVLSQTDFARSVLECLDGSFLPEQATGMGLMVRRMMERRKERVIAMILVTEYMIRVLADGNC